MTSQFSPKVSEILAFSREEAERLASRSVGPEHLLLGLLRMNDGPVIDVFHRLNLNLRSIKTELESFCSAIVHNTTPAVTIDDGINVLKLAYRILDAVAESADKVKK